MTTEVNKPHYMLQVEGPPNTTKTKCTPCGIPTDHEWLRVVPMNTEVVLDALAEIELHRRLIMCTACGNMSLKK